MAEDEQPGATVAEGERGAAERSGPGSAAEELDRLAEIVCALRTRLDGSDASELGDVDAAELAAAERRLAAVGVDLSGDGPPLAEVIAERERLRAELERLQALRRLGVVASGLALYRSSRGRARRVAKRVLRGSPRFGAAASYARWVALYDTLTEADHRRIRRRLAGLADAPTISVLMPVHDPDLGHLEAAITSVRDQLFERWQLCIADDASTNPAVPALLDRVAAADERIRVVRRVENGRIALATNSALELATGDWVAFLDHDDVLAPHALASVAFELERYPGAAMVYSDEDRLDEAGRRFGPFFKPDFDPVLLLGQNFICHLVAMRRSIVEQVGGLRDEFDGAQDYDLVLRVTERLEESAIRHVPRVLYHWRAHAGSTASAITAKSHAPRAGRRAVAEHLERTKRPGEVFPVFDGTYQRVRWPDPKRWPKVAIVVPTRDGALLQRCLDSVKHLSTYPDYEVIVVDNGSRSRATLAYLATREQDLVPCRVLRDPRPFNFAALNNRAVATTDAEVVCLLNDDAEVLTPGWLEEMVRELLQPQVGAVGAKLYYSDGTVQHAGVVLGVGGIAGHAFRHFDRLAPGYFGAALLPRRYSAVTGACMVVRRAAWDALGGLDEEVFGVSFNDVDFCLRLGQAGWKVVWTPAAELYHHESVSRGADTDGRNVARATRERGEALARWAPRFLHDPCYNPNLTLEAEDFSLAWPSRAPFP